MGSLSMETSNTCTHSTLLSFNTSLCTSYFYQISKLESNKLRSESNEPYTLTKFSYQLKCKLIELQTRQLLNEYYAINLINHIPWM